MFLEKLSIESYKTILNPISRATATIFLLHRQRRVSEEGTLADGSNCVAVSEAVIRMTVGSWVTVFSVEPVDVTVVASSFVRVSIVLDVVLVVDF